MSIKITINPAYQHLREFIENVPQTFDSQGQTIHHLRNQIKIFEVGEYKINVKAYRIPIFFNRIAYSFLRDSKARRAFYYATELTRRNINTPEPIAFIEEYRHGLFRKSFFISIQLPYRYQMGMFKDSDPAEYITDKTDIITGFAQFTALLHEKGILHKDYSPGNILFDKIDGKYEYSLIDINRMLLDQKIDYTSGCYNFSRIRGNKAMIDILGREYAKARGYDQSKTAEFIWQIKTRDEEKRQAHKRRKRFFKNLNPFSSSRKL